MIYNNINNLKQKERNVMQVTLHPQLIQLLQTYQVPVTNTTDINSAIRMFDEPDDRTQEPISSYDDINRIVQFFLLNHRYRDAMLFVLGINFGIRVSDLSTLQFKQIINSETNQIKDYFFINEEKTSKKNKIWINTACKKIIYIYLSYCNSIGVTKDLQDYLFVSESNNKKYIRIPYTQDGITTTKRIQAPVTYNTLPPILKNTCKELGIKGKHNTHCLRKTFSWGVLQHYKRTQGEDYNGRGLLFLQRRFKHSSPLTTTHYVGITESEDKAVCMSLNLGMKAIDEWLGTERR